MKQALDDPSLGIKVIDVREPDEYQIAHVEGVPLFPLSSLPQQFTAWTPTSRFTSIARAAGARCGRCNSCASRASSI